MLFSVATPKVGEKRKLDTSLANQTPGKGNKKALSSKPGMPAAAASLTKGKPTPAQTPKTPQLVKAQTPQGKKTPQMKKTPQAKTPTSSGKGLKKTPQKPADDEDEDDEDDDEEEEDIAEFEMDSDDDDEDDSDDSLEEDMDDDDDDEDDDEGNIHYHQTCWKLQVESQLCMQVL